MSHYTSTSITTTTPSIPVPFPVPSALSLLYCTALHLKLLIDYHIIYKCCFLLLFLLPTLSFSFYIIHLLLLFLYYIMLPFNLEIFFFILVVILLLTDRLTDWLIDCLIHCLILSWMGEWASESSHTIQAVHAYVHYKSQDIWIYLIFLFLPNILFLFIVEFLPQ